MDFGQKYQLMDPLPGEGVQSFRARQTQSGREVTAHLLPGASSSPETKALLARMLKLPPESLSRILEVGEYQGASFVVLAAPPFLHLFEWLKAQEPGASSPAPVATSDFEQLYETGSTTKPPEEAPSPGEVRGAFAVQTTPPAASQPGEFTKMFQAAPQTEAPPPPPPPASAIAANPHEPSEFTRMFKTLGTSPQERVETTPKAADEPGEFTKLFKTHAYGTTTRTSTIQPAAPPPSPPPPTAPADEPGEFTKMFAATPPPMAPPTTPPSATQIGRAAQDVPKPPQPAPARADDPGEFTRMFASTPPPTAPPSAPPSATQIGRGVQDAPKPVPPQIQSQPGEFTRVFQAQPPAGPMPTSQPAWTPPAPPSSGPGDYTRIFGQAPPASPTMQGQFNPPKPLDGPVTEQSGSFTAIFGRQPTPPQTPMGMPTTPPVASAPPAAPAGPSEYTRLFANPQPPSAPAPPAMAAPPVMAAPQMPTVAPPAAPQFAPPAAPQPRVIKETSTNPILVAITAVASFLLGVLVTYFLMRK